MLNIKIGPKDVTVLICRPLIYESVQCGELFHNHPAPTIAARLVTYLKECVFVTVVLVLSHVFRTCCVGMIVFTLYL